MSFPPSNVPGLINTTSPVPMSDQNNTDGDPWQNKTMQKAYIALVPTVLFLTMLAMGCGVDFEDVKKHIKKPTAPLIGLFSQLFMMPATAFGLAHALQLDNHFAIGMVIIGSCPGGAISNIFTFWSRGDLSLSISMTLLSTVLALGFMPLNMFIYLRSWTDVNANTPFANIAMSIAATWIPVAIGLFVRYKYSKAANIIVKIGSLFGMLLILTAACLQVYLNPKFLIVPWQLYVGGFVLPILGFALGFIVASITCLPLQMRRTIGFETGLQNTGLALSVIALSYPPKYASKLTLFPLFFAAGQTVTGLTVSIAHLIYFRIVACRVKRYSTVIDAEEHSRETSNSDDYTLERKVKENEMPFLDVPSLKESDV